MRPVGFLLLLLLALRTSWPSPAEPLEGACDAWIRVKAPQPRLVCGAPVALAAWMPGLEAARVGDTYEVARGRFVRTPTNPDVRLALGGRLDVNRASSDELQAVRGIGPRMAARIVATRPFASWQDLQRVRGIGPATSRRLSRSLRLGPPPPLWPSSPRPGASAPGTPSGFP